MQANLRKISSRKYQPNFQYYVKKIEAQARNWFSSKKNVYSFKRAFLSDSDCLFWMLFVLMGFTKASNGFWYPS